jgi:hypothetical protein
MTKNSDQAVPVATSQTKRAGEHESTSRVYENVRNTATRSETNRKISYADKVRQPPHASAELIDSVNKDMIKMERRLQKREKELEAEQSMTEQLEITNAELEITNSQLENKNAKLLSDNAKLQFENAKLESENTKLGSENAQLNCEKTKMTYEISGLREKGNVQSTQLDNCKTRMNFLDKVFSEVVNKILKPYAAATAMDHPEKFNPEMLMATMEHLSRDAMQARALRPQVQALQDEMLAKVEKVHSISDDNLAQSFRNIISLVKSLSRTTCPLEGQDMVLLIGTPHLLTNVAPNQWSNRARKKLFIEAWIWSALVGWVFLDPFKIFGKEGHEYDLMFKKMFGEQLPLGWPIPTPQSETWRYTTTGQLTECIRPEVFTCWEVKQEYNGLEKDFIEGRLFLLDGIASALKYFLPRVDPAPIRRIIDQAYALASQMYLQRFRLMITYPGIGDAYDSDRMVSVPGVDGEELDEGVVAFVFNPSLSKYGDVHGKNLDKRCDIVPSFVQLESIEKETILQQNHDSGVSKR